MKKLIASLIALLVILPNAYAQEEVDPNSVKGKIDKLFNLTRETGKAFIANENVQATASTVKEVGLAAAAKSSDLLYSSNSYCSILQDSTQFQQQFWFTDVLGAYIQKALIANDPYVIERLPKLFFVIKEKNWDVVDVNLSTGQIEEFKAQIFEPLDEFNYNDFDNRWDAFWAKKLTKVVGSYRCPEDYWLHDGTALSTAVETALDIAIHLGDEKARTRLQPYLPTY